MANLTHKRRKNAYTQHTLLLCGQGQVVQAKLLKTELHIAVITIMLCIYDDTQRYCHALNTMCSGREDESPPFHSRERTGLILISYHSDRFSSSMKPLESLADMCDEIRQHDQECTLQDNKGMTSIRFGEHVRIYPSNHAHKPGLVPLNDIEQCPLESIDKHVCDGTISSCFCECGSFHGCLDVCGTMKIINKRIMRMALV